MCFAIYFLISFWSSPLLVRLTDFLGGHLVLGVLLASAGWFFGGYWDFQQGLKHHKEKEGFFWAGVGIFILAAYSVGALFSRMWLDSFLAVAGISLETWHWKHWRQWAKPPSAGADKISPL